MQTKSVECIIEKSYMGGPLQTSRLGFFNLFHETLVILSNINSFHPAADAQGVRGATERRAGQRADGGTGLAGEGRTDGSSNGF